MTHYSSRHSRPCVKDVLGSEYLSTRVWFYTISEEITLISQKGVWLLVLAYFDFEHNPEAASVCGPVLAWYMFLFLFSSLDLDVPGEGGIKTGLLMYSIYFYEGVTIFTNVWILLSSVDTWVGCAGMDNNFSGYRQSYLWQRRMKMQNQECWKWP